MGDFVAQSREISKLIQSARQTIFFGAYYRADAAIES